MGILHRSQRQVFCHSQRKIYEYIAEVERETGMKVKKLHVDGRRRIQRSTHSNSEIPWHQI